MPWITTTGITSWQTALKWTAEVPRSGCRGQVKPVAIHSQIHTSVCGNPRDGYSIIGNARYKRHGLPQSGAYIWARNLARDWIPAPAVLHWESPCLKQSTLKFILLSVAISAMVILLLAMRVINATDCHNPRHTFERGTWQETEFQLPPFYIESPPVWSVISFCGATFRV
jgi:hypothetical protein